ncbi:MAG: GntR family transcriptional regulator/MocR family aminotransferase [Paracoccaceae bacterium]
MLKISVFRLIYPLVWIVKISKTGKMTKSNIGSALLSVSLDRTLTTSLQAQLAGSIRRLVHQQALKSGDRLPPSRVLATELSVSRITVTSAYDQLISEGYLTGRQGSGVLVAPDLSGMPRPPAGANRNLDLCNVPPPGPLQPFASAAPDLAHFPHKDWAKLFDQVWRSPARGLLGRSDPLGWGPLRLAIAGHLRDWRGLTCDPAQIVITSGLAESISLIAKAVLAPGQTVLVEDPGHAALRIAIAANGLYCHPTGVDPDGLSIAAMPQQDFQAIAVTPSRQFPLGMTMPLSCRLHLLRWANDTGGVIIEDDYDGEYRYQGQPLPAMMSLDDRGRVIYVGSFSKVMFPGLRLGFAVFPAPCLDRVRAVMSDTGAQASIIAQPVLARFIEQGQFATHIRRMRRLYAHRQPRHHGPLHRPAGHRPGSRRDASGCRSDAPVGDKDE